LCFRSFRFPRWSQGQLGRRFDPPPPEGSLLTPMRPCVPHRPPLRFFNLASSASSSFVFRFLRDVDVGGACSPSRRVLPVLCKSPCYSYEKRAHLPRQRTTRRGREGPSFSYFTFVVFFFSCPRFSYVGEHTGLFCSLSSHRNRRGHNHGGGHVARFRLRFRVSSCPVLKSAHSKIS